LSEGVDLNALLLIKRASGIQVIDSWVTKACDETEQATPVELALADIQEVERMATEIRAIDTRIRAGDLTENQMIELLEKRESKYDSLLDITLNTKNRQACLASASGILNTSTTFQTKSGENATLSPEQEEAMMVSGKSIIAAGAGSGKTRVLAAKIAYTINELNINPDKVIATSFSRASAGELGDRANKMSGGTSAEGRQIGKTTHSVAYRITNVPRESRDRDIFNGAKYNKYMDNGKVLDEAIRQVETAPNATVPTFESEPLIDLSMAKQRPKPQQSQPVEQPPVEQPDDQGSFNYNMKALLSRTVYNIASKALSALTGGWATGDLNWAHNDLDALVKDWGAVRVVDNGYKVEVRPPNWDGWDNQEFKNLVNKMILSYGGNPSRGTKSLNSAKPFEGFPGKFAAYKDKEVVPFNQWFNFGDEKIDELLGEGGKMPSSTEFKNFIGIQKAKLKSPTELWYEDGGEVLYIAVYGAYEHIRNKNRLYNDDDSLIGAVKLLVESPKKLKEMQRQYKYIFVDEAQDLNHCQHMLFGLVAGHINPETLEPYGDGRMTAETYCLIGDDKQAIYEFRGADPDKFINISDSYGGEFKTKILRTNFRSGRNIVRSANKLIAYNKKQIPMVCNPNPEKQEGSITHMDMTQEKMGEMSPGSRDVADEIKEIVELEGWRHGKDGKDYKFGIATRTNKELNGYALELLKMGLPYYCKRDLLGSATLGAPVTLMGVKSTDDRIKTHSAYEIKNTHHCLMFYLGKIFDQRLEQLADQNNQNPLDFLLYNSLAKKMFKEEDRTLNNKPLKWRAYNKNVGKYITALKQISDYRYTDSDDFIDFVCHDIKGADGKSLLERSGENLSTEEKEDLANEADPLNETGNKEVTKEQVSEYAESGSSTVKEIFKGKSLQEGINFFEELKKASANAKKETSKECVYLGSMHSWKGLECRDLYVPMTRGQFPDKRSSIESERRLAYVAITRGQDRVTVISGPGFNKHTGGASQFIMEACIPDQEDLRHDWSTSTSLKSASMEDFDLLCAMEQYLSLNE
jgi:DNA helicase-2/ATP-dependent DNA helicase PcrA